MSDYLFAHKGGCECGAVTFTYHSHQPLSALTARACQCEFCLPRSATYLSEPDARLQVELKDRRYVYSHSFGTNTADFMHCAVCNNLVYVKSEIDGHDYALVVVAALDESAQLAQPGPVDYEGEGVSDRLQRRAERWIAQLDVS